MDPLSDVLSLLRPQTFSSGGFDAGGDWSIQFPPFDGMKCYSLVSGRCRLLIEDVPEAITLEPGDCFLLPSARAFRLCSDLALPPVDFKLIVQPPLHGSTFSMNGGGACFIAGGHFTFTGDHASLLLQALPLIVHIHREADRAELRSSLNRMSQELLSPRPGSPLVMQHLAQMVLVLAIRLYLEQDAQTGPGWLSALTDRQLSTAMYAMHEAPAHPWTLQTLAEHAGLSRTVLASRFKTVVGSSVMEYLSRWRMLRAGDRLRTTGDSVSQIGFSLGYESESAFSKAFKRVMGSPPRQYARRRPERGSA